MTKDCEIFLLLYILIKSVSLDFISVQFRWIFQAHGNCFAHLRPFWLWHFAHLQGGSQKLTRSLYCLHMQNGVRTPPISLGIGIGQTANWVRPPVRTRSFFLTCLRGKGEWMALRPLFFYLTARSYYTGFPN